MPPTVRLSDAELDSFIQMDDADQWTLVDSFLNLAALYELAVSLDHKYKGARWPIARRVARRIRERLDPSPFLALPIAEQLERLQALHIEDVRGLHNACCDWAEDSGPEELPISPAVLALMLERIDEAAHVEYEEDPEVRDALDPAALAKVREESDLGKVGPVLAAEREHRDRLIATIDFYALDDLKTNLERYSQKKGRSDVWRETYQAVCARLESLGSVPLHKLFQGTNA